METEIISLNPDIIDEDKLSYVANIIKRGGLVAFPTETVYGLGANALDSLAVNNIFIAKGRPADNPLIVHIDGYTMLDQVTDCSIEQKAIIKSLGDVFWPGPLTIIAPRAIQIPEIVSCGLSTVGVRFPEHPIARALITAVGLPIAAPSANSSGKPSPTEAEHVIDDLYGKIEVIIDGGKCQVGLESTVLDITCNPALILRPGAVTREMILFVLPEVEEHIWMDELQKPIESPKSPGMKYTHYAPKAQVTIYQGSLDKVVLMIKQEFSQTLATGRTPGILATDQTINLYDTQNVISLGDRKNPETLASNLFTCLRTFDKLGIDVVFAEAISIDGIGDAVMNRLYRAAGCRLVIV